MTTRNLLESDHPAVPWLLAPAFLALVIILLVLVAAAPAAAAALAVALGAVLMVAFFRMGRRQ